METMNSHLLRWCTVQCEHNVDVLYNGIAANAGIEHEEL